MTTKLCPMRPYKVEIEEQTNTMSEMNVPVTRTEFSECIGEQCAWYVSRFNMCAMLSIGLSFD
jgi:hypothetical protein